MPLVLVVDDEPDIRAIMQINLEGAGYRVALASDGAEALEAVRADPPDAMFLDVRMPGIDGWTVLERLKAERDLSAIPVFLITALDDDRDRLRGGIEGALRYITKPFDPVELVRALEQVLDPGAPTEPELRRRVQSAALEALARLERGEPEAAPGAPRVHLTRLEHTTGPIPPSPRVRAAQERVGELTPRQRELLEMFETGASVSGVSRQLGVSRGNVYAALRRIARRLGLKGTTELLALLRQRALLERLDRPDS